MGSQPCAGFFFSAKIVQQKHIKTININIYVCRPWAPNTFNLLQLDLNKVKKQCTYNIHFKLVANKLQ
jgi:hypothetical protein